MSDLATKRIEAANKAMAAYSQTAALKMLNDVLYSSTPDITGKTGLRFGTFLFDVNGTLAADWAPEYLRVQSELAETPNHDLAAQKQCGNDLQELIRQNAAFANAVVEQYERDHPVDTHSPILDAYAATVRRPSTPFNTLGVAAARALNGSEHKELGYYEALVRHVLFVDGNPAKGVRTDSAFFNGQNELQLTQDTKAGRALAREIELTNQLETIPVMPLPEQQARALQRLALHDMTFHYVMGTIMNQARNDRENGMDYTRNLPDFDSLEASVSTLMSEHRAKAFTSK